MPHTCHYTEVPGTWVVVMINVELSSGSPNYNLLRRIECVVCNLLAL